MTATATAAPTTTPIPLAKGERYVGLTLHEGRPHHLVLLPGDTPADWAAAKAWAAERGGELPSRLDMLVLLEHARDAFKREVYWANQQPADAPACAWYQGFDWGIQSYWLVDNAYRARAVRRVAI